MVPTGISAGKRATCINLTNQTNKKIKAFYFTNAQQIDMRDSFPINDNQKEEASKVASPRACQGWCSATPSNSQNRPAHSPVLPQIPDQNTESTNSRQDQDETRDQKDGTMNWR